MPNNEVSNVILVEGMTCASCEKRIENELKGINGVSEVKISYETSVLEVKYDQAICSFEDIVKAIEALGYNPVIKDNIEEYSGTQTKEKVGTKSKIKLIVGIAIVLLAVYLMVDNTLGFNFTPQINQTMGLGILFVIGLLTSMHCIAMCGGINLSQSISYCSSDEKGRYNTLKPAVLYNLGRVISYTVIGGIAGAIGSVIAFTGGAKGIVAIAAGIFMVLMGLNMLNIFPGLRRFGIKVPGFIAGRIQNSKSNKAPFFVGLLNGLMPCGPLQAMQIYALGTGSLLAGAASMFVFSLGTVPLMLGFGIAGSFLSSRFTKRLLKVSAILVMVMGIMMVDRGLALSGVALIPKSKDFVGNSKVEGKVQVLNSIVEANRYTPSTLVVQKGIPVRWEIEAKELNGCNNPITIPELGIEKRLVKGKNIIEFTPEKEGTIVYTCWMGMISGRIEVMPDANNQIQSSSRQEEQKTPVIGSSGGCCRPYVIDSETDNPKIKENESVIDDGKGKSSTNKAGSGTEQKKIQIINSVVEASRYAPDTLIVQKGVPVRWEIEAKELNGCNNPIIVPELGIEKKLVKGKNIIEFTPEKEGTIVYTCWMGMISGKIKVVSGARQVSESRTKLETQSTKTQTTEPSKDKRELIGKDELSLSNKETKSVQESEESKKAGGCCGLSSTDTSAAGNSKSQNTIGVAEIENGLQTVSIKVVEDIHKINVEEIRNEFKDYSPKGSSNCCSNGER